MTPLARTAIVGVVAAALVVAFVARERGRTGADETPGEADAPAASATLEIAADALESGSAETAAPEMAAADAASETVASAPLPRLLDLGSDKCVPCKMMAPMLEELRKTHAGAFRTEFVDVWKDREVGAEYGIRVIPTQIFFDAAGKERWRHEGYLSREAILEKWAELGVELPASAASAPSSAPATGTPRPGSES